MEDFDPLARNKDLSDVLSLIGSYYIMAKDSYRAKAFNTAADKIAQHQNIILTGAQARKELSGIGDSIQQAIDEYINTGTVKRLQELETQFHDRKIVINYFMSFYGIGPVTAVKFYNQGFRTLEDLWFKGNLADAQKTGIIWRDHINHRIMRDEMNTINSKIGSILDPYQIKWVITGSYRREEPSSGDIDILVQSRSDFNMDGLVTIMASILPASLANGPTKFMGILRLDDSHYGHRVDIRLIDKSSWAAALMYFTGSQRFNILMRQRAIEFGWTLNEYGLYDNNANPIQVETEEDIFIKLRVKYIPPKDRIKTLNNLTFI